ncbi:alpha-protein kinase 2-like isoform X2 [Lethenteron reissneri]|nr:alpha-protein kinase 2-like isoform X2 [Lethenteron reissneri]
MGEGMRRRAHRAVVVEGMCPPFGVGAACVVKVHSALGEGGQPGPQLVESNRRLAVQECWVQGAARQLCRRFASEASALPGFGSTPEVIPLYLLTRPGRPAAHATVEVQLPGRFAKYSPRDGRELSAGAAGGTPSEAGMKCVAFQHWVFVRSGGRLLVTDLQGVGLHLTDVGIATRDKEFQGVRGNFPSSALAQFVALHECSPHCALLGLGPLRRASRAPPLRTPPAARLAAAGTRAKGRGARFWPLPLKVTTLRRMSEP